MTEIAAFTLASLLALAFVSGGLLLGLLFVYLCAMVAQVGAKVYGLRTVKLPQWTARRRLATAAIVVRAVPG